jgi:hypothetical protein
VTAAAEPDAELVRDIRLHIAEGRSYVQKGTDEDAFAVWIDAARDLADRLESDEVRRAIETAEAQASKPRPVPAGHSSRFSNPIVRIINAFEPFAR